MTVLCTYLMHPLVRCVMCMHACVHACMNMVCMSVCVCVRMYACVCSYVCYTYAYKSAVDDFVSIPPRVLPYFMRMEPIDIII